MKCISCNSELFYMVDNGIVCGKCRQFQSYKNLGVGIDKKYQRMWIQLQKVFQQIICPSKSGELAVMDEIEKDICTNTETTPNSQG